MFLSRKCGKSFSQGKDQNRGLGSHEKGLQLNDERIEAIMVLKGFVDDNALALATALRKADVQIPPKVCIEFPYPCKKYINN